MQFLASELEGKIRKNIHGFRLFPARWKKLFPMVLVLPAVPKRFLKSQNWKDSICEQGFLRSRKLIVDDHKACLSELRIGLVKWLSKKMPIALGGEHSLPGSSEWSC